MNFSKLASKEFLKFASVPLGLMVFALLAWGFYQALDLPRREEIIAFAEQYYQSHGYWLVFLGAVAEGLLLVNWYVPGSIVVVFGVALARQDPAKAAVMVLLIMLGFFITSVVNYALGRFGWYRLLLKFGLEKPLDGIKRKVERRGLAIIFSTYLHPNLGALTATSAGILHLSFKKFLLYSAVSLLAWNTLWGVVVYAVGPSILNILGMQLVVALLLVWIIVLAVKYFKNKTAGSHISIP